MPRILVVDDGAGMREVLEAMLTHGGFDVETAESSEQAMRLYIDHVPFDVILTDPTGLEFAHFVRNTNPSQPMVFMSAFENLVEEQRNNFTFSLFKLFDMHELCQTLRQAISENRRHQVN